MHVSEKLFILYAFVVFCFIIIIEFEDRDRFLPCSINYSKASYYEISFDWLL